MCLDLYYFFASVFIKYALIISHISEVLHFLCQILEEKINEFYKFPFIELASLIKN